MKIDERNTFNSVARLGSSLFTSVLVDETIEILAEKAFIDHWFNKEYDLNITKKDFMELLEVQASSIRWKFVWASGQGCHGLFPQAIMANAFICNIEEKLKNQNKMPASFYERYVDAPLAKCNISLRILINTEWNPPLIQFHNGISRQRQASLRGMVIE